MRLIPKKDLRQILGCLNRRTLAGVDRPAPNDALNEALSTGGRFDQIANELTERLVGQQRLVEPGGDLLPAAVDVAGSFIVVAQQVIPE